MSSHHTGNFALRAIRDTYMGQGVSFGTGELHHFRFATLEDAVNEIAAWWNTDDWEICDLSVAAPAEETT